MIKKIKLGDKELSYSLRSYKLSRRLRLSIYNNGEVSVTKPVFVSERMVEKFLKNKADWILSRLAEKEEILIQTGGVIDSVEVYKENKKRALEFITLRLKYLNSFYDFKYNKISVRRQKTRWGSCSLQGNLSFNYRIVFLAKDVADYVIVHELCHLREFNHSPAFWKLVEKTIPDYKLRRRSLKGLVD